jgi:NADH-quinone oxidoreductase subunit H
MFFLGEYGNMLVLAFMITLFFLGGWVGPLMGLLPIGFWYILKVLGFAFSYIFVRANLPRYRYDQLMSIGWKVLLPLTLGYLGLVLGLLYSTVLPVTVNDWLVTYMDTTAASTIN